VSSFLTAHQQAGRPKIILTKSIADDTAYKLQCMI